jgi:RHS repeat-associated protein
VLIAGIASADGTITERYEYDAYGKPYILDADYTVDGTSDIANPYLFTGRQLDTLDSGGLLIQYSRARYYDYETGRWYQREPLGYVDGMGLYEYVKNRVVFLFESARPICDYRAACDAVTCNGGSTVAIGPSHQASRRWWGSGNRNRVRRCCCRRSCWHGCDRDCCGCLFCWRCR